MLSLEPLHIDWGLTPFEDRLRRFLTHFCVTPVDIVISHWGFRVPFTSLESLHFPILEIHFWIIHIPLFMLDLT